MHMHMLLCFHFFLGFLVTVHAQNASCPALCTCAFHGRSNGQGLRTVLCKNPALTAIPSGLPTDTVKFRLERTSVSRVLRGAFSGLPDLVYLWLTYNSITILHPRSFTNLTSLHELRLDGNLLSSFPWEGLKDMPRLRTLGLHNNRLARVPPQAARYLGNITYLDLSSNKLSTLPNELITLWPINIQNEPQRSVVLGLQDNPWLCDCRLSILLDVSKAPESSLVLLDRFLTCIGPPHLAGIPFQSVELPRCRRPSVLTSATKVTTLLGSNVLLRCDARGYPTPALIWIKSAQSNTYNTACCRQIDSAETEKLPKKLPSFQQESPRTGLRWSVISLNGISYKDAGEYRCRAQNLAGTSEAVVSLNVVGVFSGDWDSEKTSILKPFSKLPPSEKKPSQRLKITPNVFPKNITGSLLTPKRILTTPKASRDKMKRDRTGIVNLPQS